MDSYSWDIPAGGQLTFCHRYPSSLNFSLWHCPHPYQSPSRTPFSRSPIRRPRGSPCPRLLLSTRRRPWTTRALFSCAHWPSGHRRSWRARRGTTAKWAAVTLKNCWKTTGTSWFVRALPTQGPTYWRACTMDLPNTCCWWTLRAR